MKFTGERFIPSKSGVIALQHYHRYEFALHLIDFSKKVVLDIACGEGYGANILAARAEKVYGVDISEEAIDSAKKIYADERMEFLLGSVTNIPIPDRSIDIVVSFETIEHHDKHLEMMTEVKRVLKDNGVLVISTPDKGYYEKHLPQLKNEFHVKELYKHEFESLLRKYFKNYYSFAQNNVFGSVITCESDCAGSFGLPLHFNKARDTKGSFEARFIIAVACDSEIKFDSTTSFFTYSPESDPFTEIENKTKVIESIHNSRTWKILAVLKKPFDLLKRLVKHDL
jgi:ubiquinone/menaquinone biosynthesis C-methylase UbiE